MRRRDGAEESTALTTLREAGAFAGVEPDVAWASEFDIPPPGDLDAPLDVDAGRGAPAGGLPRPGGRRPGGAAGQRGARGRPLRHPPVAGALRRRHRERLGGGGLRATYGASPGDDGHPEPYLYVGPWERRAGRFWNDAAFGGASLGEAELRASDDPQAAALAFYERGRRELAA